MDLSGNSPASCYHKTSKKTVASSATAKSTGKSTASSAIVVKPAGKAAVSSANPMEPNAATDLSSMPGEQVMFFREVSLGPREAELMFRMIHFWEARNPHDDAHWTRDASYRRRGLSTIVFYFFFLIWYCSIEMIFLLIYAFK